MTKESKTGSAPVSFAQERLWFLDQINPGDPSANISCGIRIKGELNYEVLRQSLQAIIDRHESLRTTFATNQLQAVRDSKPVQLIAEKRTAAIPVINLSDQPNRALEIKARELAKTFARNPFDLTLGPLLRATLLRLDPREHVLLLSLHRIVCDDRSLEILTDELWAAYAAFVKKEPWEVSPLQSEYTDYALRQLQSIEEESFRLSLDFWRAKVEGAPAVIELPTDRPRPPVQTWHGQSVSLELDKDLLEELRSIAAGQKATIAFVLMAALRLVLARYSRQQDLVIGTTVPNRDSLETKQVIGPVSNLLSLRASVPRELTFLELLGREQSTAVEAHANRFVPFEKLLDELKLDRSLGHAPVFQVTFNLKEEPKNRSEVVGLQLERFEFDEDDIIGYDLMVDAYEGPNNLVCRFRYSTDLFDRTTIERLTRHFKNVLEGVVTNPTQKVSGLPLLTESEQRQILLDWNNTQTTFEQRGTVVELFERQAASTPSAVAVTFQDEHLIYAELNARANQLARHLRTLGVGPETVVGICVERSLETVIGLLGILKAGGAYLPLDPGLPKERLAFMMEDAGARAVVTLSALSKDLPPHQATVVALDADHEVISAESTENLATPVTDESLAYVIYTSGSTGKPKGVQVSHSALANFLNSMRAQPGISASDVLLSVTTLSFDIAGLEIYLPLTVGARLVVASRKETSDGVALSRLIRQCGATLMQATPATWRLLIDSGWNGEAKLRILCGGEALSRDLANQLLERGAELWNLYGPTETTIWSTLKQVSAPVDEITIGKPIANTQTYILDQQMQPVPIGVAGELHIGGEGVARGYLNRPELTAEKFVSAPWAEGQRLYKTGDLARYLPDGDIEYLGRLDHQVKIRGFRIELGEIESVLREHGSVRDVVVVAREGQLVAYVVATQEQASDRAKLWSQLREFIKSRLPEYMLPAIFVELAALPLTPSGKIDRRNLPAPDQARPDLQQAYVAPRDRVEEQLATLWTHLLKLKSVGMHDNFFELGGHSLLAARLFAQIENRFGKHLPLATLFQSPTIEQLANVMRNSQERSWSSLVAIQPEGSRQRLFCIHAAGANVLIYRPLSRHLGNDQPVYALQAQGLDGSRPLKTVEKMAAHYIEEMRLFQPEGPYHLLGASFGGLVIYEMAYQLSRENQKVGLLAMLNTNCPVYTLGKRIASHVVHLREHGPRFYGRAVINGLARRLNRYVPLSISTSGPSGNGTARDLEIRQVLEADRDRDEALVQTVSAILRAEEVYDPTGRIYPGKVTLFRAIDAQQDFHENRLGWGNLAQGGVEVHDVPGTHTSMREEPNVALLVEKLKPCLEKAQLTRD